MWALAALALGASLAAGGCGPAETAVTGPESTGAGAPIGQSPRPTSEGIATPSADPARARAVADSAAKSDARSLATMMEVYYTDFMAYPRKLIERQSAAGTTIGFPKRNTVSDSVKLSPGTSASVRSDGQSYCITMTNPAATRPWIYDSDTGGVQTAPDAACDVQDGVAILGS